MSEAGPVRAPTAGALLSRVRVVLCRPKNPQNLGAAARALRNTGISRWTLVDPQCDPFDPEATRVAVHAEGLLQLAQIVPTLEQALAGAALSIGASARLRFERPPLLPQAAAEQLIEVCARLERDAHRPRLPSSDRAAPRVRRGGSVEGQEVALVFGDERVGLTNDEADACDLLTSIPSAPEQPSWNLAQAIAIYSYCVRTAALAHETKETLALGAIAEGGRAHKNPRVPHLEERHGADGGQLAHLDGNLSALLDRLKRERLHRRLMVTLARARLTEREAVLWSALIERIRRTIEP